jgi:hypothetical protein
LSLARSHAGAQHRAPLLCAERAPATRLRSRESKTDTKFQRDRELVEVAMKIETNTRLVPHSDTNSIVTYAARNEGLRQENARLKELVVKLSVIIAKNVAMQHTK